jgi:hypothetical protein
MNPPKPESFKRLKKPSCIILFLFAFQILVSQNNIDELTKYSHTEFVELLTNSKDSVFSLKDAFIYLDEEIDTSYYYENIDNSFVFPTNDSLLITAKIKFENVHFEHLYDDFGAGLHHIKFKETVEIENSSSIVFSNCVFEKGINVDINIPLNPIIDNLSSIYDSYSSDITINESIIKDDFIIDIGTIETFSSIFLTVTKNTFYKKNSDKNFIYTNNIRSFDFYKNEFLGEGFAQFFIDTTGDTLFIYNDFGDLNVLVSQRGISSSSSSDFSENIFKETVLLEIEDFSKVDLYHWNDWEGKVISIQGYLEYVKYVYKEKSLNEFDPEKIFLNDSILQQYNNKYKFELENSFKFEKRVYGYFYDFYKSQYDTEFSNNVYVSLKDLDTNRYKYLNEKEPSFKTYFTWKINQFLRIFSAYGTSPSKTVITSIYIIIIFAFIYLFFPNSWDTLNRNRLIKRIRFYTRYFRGKESMKDIYVENKKEDIMTFQEFKEYMNQSKKETPSYFLWLARPIYYFSTTNYKIASTLFEKTDILKGKWVDLPRNKKIIASIFMGIWIFLLLCFDVFIKFLNALTLSLNTFTTLGFGEIPTKGLPRYLSIVQGFIGWFMLSIFSVALISQILN